MLLLCLLCVHPGLGTSTSKEAKEYFSDMQRHRIPFKYAGPEDDEAITLVSCLLLPLCSNYPVESIVVSPSFTNNRLLPDKKKKTHQPILAT